MTPRCRIALLGLCLGLCLGLAAPAAAGELNVYYGTSRDLFEPVVQAFAASRPDIKVSSYRAPTEELMATDRAGDPSRQAARGRDRDQPPRNSSASSSNTRPWSPTRRRNSRRSRRNCATRRCS